MRTLGLTGSVAMGKTTAAGMLRRLRVPVHDADATVHKLYGPGGAAVQPIAALYPDTVVAGAVVRAKLGAVVLHDPGALRAIERIVHPLVTADRHCFVRESRRRGVRLVAFDIPLLFETEADRMCDLVAVVTAPPWLQRRRALARPGMTPQKLADILARQLPDAQKRRRADFVIPTGLGHAVTWRALRRMVDQI